MTTKFVFLGDGGERAYQSFADIIDLENVQYIPDIYASVTRFERILFRLHTSEKLNKCIHLPFKQVWTKRVLKNVKFKDSEDLVFVLFNFWIKYDELKTIEFIRINYPKSKIVWNLRDIVSSLLTLSSRLPLDIPSIKSKLDLIVSFDYSDCRRYGFEYFPLVFSEFKGTIDKMADSDVFFIGMAKDRLNEILSVFEKCEKEGLTCDFHIVGVPEQLQKYKDKIIYNKYLSYHENLQHILHTKCLVELMQGGSDGYTQRVCEAICFNKRLITNNSKIREAPFYSNQLIYDLNCDNRFSEFANKLKSNDEADYNYKKELSPLNMLYFIEKKLKFKC